MPVRGSSEASVEGILDRDAWDLGDLWSLANRGRTTWRNELAQHRGPNAAYRNPLPFIDVEALAVGRTFAMRLSRFWNKRPRRARAMGTGGPGAAVTRKSRLIAAGSGDHVFQFDQLCISGLRGWRQGLRSDGADCEPRIISYRQGIASRPRIGGLVPLYRLGSRIAASVCFGPE